MGRTARTVTSVATLAVAVLVTLPAAAATAASPRSTLQGYARDTWASMTAIVDDQSGLPADSLDADGTRSIQTSTTNIGAYMWSTIVAERLGLIGHGETVARLAKTIGTVDHMERY